MLSIIFWLAPSFDTDFWRVPEAEPVFPQPLKAACPEFVETVQSKRPLQVASSYG